MRFSLLTLLLFVFWIGLGMVVWVHRHPWQVHGVSIQPTIKEDGAPANSPDGRRQFTRRGGWAPFGWGEMILIEIPPGERPPDAEICGWPGDPQSTPALCEFNYASTWNHTFIDNDTFAFSTWNMESSDGSERSITMKRRFPEWWWGHFFRLEVWLFALTGITLLVRGVRHIRDQKRRVSALGTGRGICPGSSSSLAGTHA